MIDNNSKTINNIKKKIVNAQIKYSSLIKNNISYIDVSLHDKRFFIKHDKHFNKLANEMWLNKLNKYLVTLKP